MNVCRTLAVTALVALAASLVPTAGCSPKHNPIVPSNQPPVVRITSAPIDTTQRNYYVITVNWIGHDPDGRVDHFIYAIDPPMEAGADTLYTMTTDFTLTRSYACPSPDRQDSTRRSADFHVFVIKAVDNNGAVSAPVARAFWSFTQAPRVQIVHPRASSLVKYYVTPTTTIRWEGFDDDGVFTQKPVQYKFKMLTSETEVKLADANVTPDLVRQYYAPRHWAGWDSLPGDTTEKQYSGLNVDQDYLFVIVAFDEVGAYSPIFSRNANMVLMKVTYSGAQLPKIGFFNDFFQYEYAAGSWQPSDPEKEFRLEVPAARPGHPEDRLTFKWYALPATDTRGNPIGGPIRSYRWAVDIINVFDETERSDEELDLTHWSQKSSAVTSCRIGPYSGGEIHKFYLEAEDVNNLKSLGIIRFTSVLPTFESELLIVDDTRLTVDRVAPNTSCPQRPLGNWPTAAELDTFLYARGDVPWLCYPPVGGQPQLSTPGVFSAFKFDTLGTNTGGFDLTVPLSRLGRYRHVIWLVDGGASSRSGEGTNIDNASTSLRYMNDRQHANTLATYVRQGGLVWVAGGGAASASLYNFDKTNNNTTNPIPRTTTFAFSNGELGPGRFIYDQAHWRSEIKQFPVNPGVIRRYLGRFQSSPGIYQNLPELIQAKTPGTDPFPPNRTGQPPSNFYQTQFTVEFLSAPNEIIEDLDPRPSESFESTLDTLYKVTGPSLQPDTGPGALQSVTMTYYHGLDNAPFVMSGFSLWTFRRSQCVGLVDFVLQQLWGILPEPRVPGPQVVAPAVRRPPAGRRAQPLGR